MSLVIIPRAFWAPLGIRLSVKRFREWDVGYG